jgi:hypothetical protein
MRRGERQQPGRRVHVEKDRLDAAPDEVGLVPKAGPARVPQQRLPPPPVGLRSSPPLQRVEVPPVLADAQVRWDQPEQQELMQQQPVGCRLGRAGDPGTVGQQRLQAPQGLACMPR